MTANGVLSGYTPAVEVPVPGAPPGVGPLSRAGLLNAAVREAQGLFW